MSLIFAQMLKWVFATFAAMMCGYLHWRHAEENYPFSNVWRFSLFISGFLAGTLGIWGLMLNYDFAGVLVGMIFGGVPFGFISLCRFPRYMQSMLPKKEKIENGDK